jgi:hypothetical protein
MLLDTMVLDAAAEELKTKSFSIDDDDMRQNKASNQVTRHWRPTSPAVWNTLSDHSFLILIHHSL